jgi:Ca2+-binding EF-hand superfamily protein
MNSKLIAIALFATLLLTASIVFAGHHYHGYGHGCMVSSWDMTEMDTNQDGSLSFDEFSGARMEQLRAAYDMIDANKDGIIDDAEWKNLLRVHGMDTE